MTAEPSATAEFGPAWSAGLRRAPEAELDAWLAFALDTADVADDIARHYFRRDLRIEAKPDRTFVTIADREIERTIRDRIGAAFPEHGIHGEEEGEAGAGARTRWWIDPIDGTHNFIRGVPVFGLLLALEHDGELQLGVVSMPALRERWWARRGGGAWAVDTVAGAAAPRRVAVSGVADVADAQVLYGSATDLETGGRVPGFRGLLRSAWRDRGLGDCWGYVLVAQGSAEAMVEADLHAWDLAAPTVVVEEAGGRITDLDGRRTIHGGIAVATNGHLHDAVLARLREPAVE